jgi:hypothetical protein
MIEQTQAESKTGDAKVSKRVISGETITGYAVFGCLVAGTIGIFKAIDTEGIGTAACLLAAVAAFGMVCYIYFRKD